MTSSNGSAASGGKPNGGIKRKDGAIRAYTSKNCLPKGREKEIMRLVERLVDPYVLRMRDRILAMGAGYEADILQYCLLSIDAACFANLVFSNHLLQSDVAVKIASTEKPLEYELEEMQLFLRAYDRSGDSNYENPAIGVLVCRDERGPCVAYAFAGSESPLNGPVYRDKESLPEPFRTLLPGLDVLLDPGMDAMDTGRKP